MSNFVTVVSNSNKIREQILSEIELIENILEQGLPCLIELGGKPTSLEWAPSVIGMSASVGGVREIVRRIILDACKRGEALGPGSSNAILKWITVLTKESLGCILSGEDPRNQEEILQDGSGAFLKDTSLVASRLQLNAFQNQIKQLSNHPKAASMVLKSIELAGMESRIFVDSEPSESCLIEQVRGFNFDVYPYEDMLPEGERWAETHIKVAVIDGLIESVAEIHQILEVSSRDCEPVVIFARGFAEEVIATLSINKLRGTLNIMPIRVPFDEFSANTIKDLAVVCNTNVVSALTGDLISQINFDDLVVVDRVTFANGKTLIENHNGIRGAANLSRELTERRRESESPALINLIDYRLRSLSSSSIRIRYDKDFAPHVSEIDLLLRTSSAIIDSGVINLEQAKQVAPSCLTKAFQGVIDISKTSLSMPTLTMLATVKHGTQATTSLLSINAALMIDEDKNGSPSDSVV